MPDPISTEEVLGAVKSLREEFEKKSPNFEKIDAIEVSLEGFEAKNQELLEQVKGTEKREEEMKERVDALEVELARSGGAGEGKNYKDSEEYKSLEMFCKKGLDFLDQEQKLILRTDSDVQGGFLVTSEMDNAITKEITEISAIRTIARVRTIGAKSLEVPVRSSIPTAQYEGEAETSPEDTSTYRNETLTAFRQTVTVPITMDPSFNPEARPSLEPGE